MATCPSCGGEFERKHAWQRLCWSCWRQRENKRVEDQGYQRGFADGLAAGRRHQPQPQPQPELLEQLPRLIQLCHPDRHGGSSAATTVTQWLLELRKRFRATTH
jgi:hypothetical protein